MTLQVPWVYETSPSRYEVTAALPSHEMAKRFSSYVCCRTAFQVHKQKLLVLGAFGAGYAQWHSDGAEFMNSGLSDLAKSEPDPRPQIPVARIP